MDTPHDKPTHMLENPQQYITKSGHFIRSHSLDELPQIWDIFIGNMSVIGPRPGLWNQDLLIAERDKYGANDIRPGLTGWAQINGRDELEIPVKAKLDGDYTKSLGMQMKRKFRYYTRKAEAPRPEATCGCTVQAGMQSTRSCCMITSRDGARNTPTHFWTGSTAICRQTDIPVITVCRISLM